MSRIIDSEDDFIFEETFPQSSNIKTKIKEMYGEKAKILRVEKKNRGFLRFFLSPSVKVTGSISKKEDRARVETNLLLGKVKQMHDREAAPSTLSKEDTAFSFDIKDLKGLHSSLQFLEKKGFLTSVLEHFQEKMMSTFAIPQLQDSDFMHDQLKYYLHKNIPLLEEANFNVDSTRVVACIGPTGMGKSFSLMKLAVQLFKSIQKGVYGSIDIITLDFFKVGASEQIENFVNMIHRKFPELKDTINFLKMNESSVFHSHLRKKRRSNVLLIDTGGKSIRNSNDVMFYKDFLDYDSVVNKHNLKKALKDNLELYLVLSANISAIDLRNIIDVYSAYPIKGIIATKFDETSTLGSFLSVCIEKNIPLAYISYGHEFSNYFDAASIEKCFQYLGIE